MQSVQGSGMAPSNDVPLGQKVFIKWALLATVGIINGYATILMYSRGELAFAMLTVVLTALAIYIFGSKKTYAHRYIYPGIAGMILFILFPLIYTVGLAFTNYSAKNQLSLERTQQVLLDRTYQSGESYPFSFYKTENGYRFVIKDGEQLLATREITLEGFAELNLELAPVPSVQGKKAPIKTIIKNRTILNKVDLHMPGGEAIRMSGLRKFASVVPLYTLQADGKTMVNNHTGETLKPNMDVGYYQPVDESGYFVGNTISPGFIVNVDTANLSVSGKTKVLKSHLSVYLSGRSCSQP